MTTHFRTPNDRFPCRVTNKLTIQLGWPSWNIHQRGTRDTVSQVTAAPGRLEALIETLTTGTKERSRNPAPGERFPLSPWKPINVEEVVALSSFR